MSSAATTSTAKGRNASQQSAEGMSSSKSGVAFWIYLMTDCVLFATLFATYIVLKDQTAGSATSRDIVNLPFVFAETMVLLLSSLASGIALLYAHARKLRPTLIWLLVTGLLGAVFVAMELYEFRLLVHEGHSWRDSAYLSAYFGLVGTHGLHIFSGLLWLAGTWLYLKKRGFTTRVMSRLTMFTMFWHFLDLVWIGIFTIVYLMGAL